MGCRVQGVGLKEFRVEPSPIRRLLQLRVPGSRFRVGKVQRVERVERVERV